MTEQEIKTPYVVTEWVNEETVMDARKMQKIEDRIKCLEDARSLIDGVLDKRRMPSADLNPSSANNTTHGAVCLNSAIDLVSNSFAATSGALNTVRTYAASSEIEPDNITLRKSKRAIKAETFVNPIKISFTGGASVSTPNEFVINGNVDASKSIYNIPITITKDGHQHTRATIDAPASLTETGFVKVYRDIPGVLNFQVNDVPNMSLFTTSIDTLNKKDADLNTRITESSTRVTNILALRPETIANSEFEKAINNLGNVLEWKTSISEEVRLNTEKLESLKTSTIPGINSSIKNLQTAVGSIEGSVVKLEEKDKTLSENISTLDNELGKTNATISKINSELQSLTNELIGWSHTMENAILKLAEFVSYPTPEDLLKPTPQE